MSEFKGTPGPWVAFNENNQIGVTSESDGADVAYCKGFHTLRSPADEWANALLVAAAPDLLEALIMLQKQALQSELNNANHEWGMEALAATRAAIAKALGGQK